MIESGEGVRSEIKWSMTESADAESLASSSGRDRTSSPDLDAIVITSRSLVDTVT